MEQIRILLADPQTLFREGLKALLDNCGTVSVVGEMPRPEDVSAWSETTSPDVVLMDIAGDVSQTVRRMNQRTRVAFLTHRNDDEALAEFQQSGAAGYILKDITFAHLMEAIQIIHGGGKWVSADLLSRMSETPRAKQSSLTPREHEVLKLTAEGNSVKEIANMLDLSAKTVDAHKVNLMRKLRIHNKAQLVHYAFQKQILKLSFHAHG